MLYGNQSCSFPEFQHKVLKKLNTLLLEVRSLNGQVASLKEELPNMKGQQNNVIVDNVMR